MEMWFNLWTFLRLIRNILLNGIIGYGFWFSAGIMTTTIPSAIKDVEGLFKKIRNARTRNNKKNKKEYD
jgi:hypothetical protein